MGQKAVVCRQFGPRRNPARRLDYYFLESGVNRIANTPPVVRHATPPPLAKFECGGPVLRKPLIAGNWKMNLLRDSGLKLVRALAEQLPPPEQVAVAVCPPNVYLSDIASALRGSSIALGAQNMYHESEGAFTGEVSGQMLLDVGCRYVIVGHSERRQFFGDTDVTVNQKTIAALSIGLTPIVCVGETLEQRESGQTAQTIETQTRGSLAGLTSQQAGNLVIAYEPVWAIGTGRTATPEQAEEVHAQIRSLLTELWGVGTANTVGILYGGSVKADNASLLLGQPNIDGALVGGASLKADSFAAICAAGCRMTVAAG
ncbi:MAG: triose-phosphate isomerase [Pirellulaceae bacterium]|nr:triose-phosphate isomerase [Pirellulaceae bacterium]